MGRKIPGRKHHGVRDPIEQNELKFQKIKNTINNPPQKQDLQKVSNSLARFMKMKNITKTDVKSLTKRKNMEDVPREQKVKNKKPIPARNFKNLPNFKQMPDENDHEFLRRVNKVTKESMLEAQFEAKYKVDVIRNSETGAISMKKRAEDEIDALAEKLKKKSKLGKKAGNKIKEPTNKLKGIEKLKLKNSLRKTKKQKEKEERSLEFQREEFKFGEVCHGPPQITTLPRKAQKVETVPRPGKKNLLLAPLLNQSVNNTTDSKQKVDLTGKRKDLPEATRTMLEKNRQSVVEMYRAMKKSKQANNNAE